MQTFGLRASGASPQNPHRSACVAIYHCSVKTVSRSTGRSAPAAAAYRTGTLLVNERDGVTHDYRRRVGVEAAFIVAPDGAGWAQDRAALWNAAEAAENRKNSTVAREYEVALPAELSAEQRADLARAFAAALVERYGVAADVALHAPGGEADQRNYHAHVLTTTRTVGGSGLGPKTRALDDQRSGEIERVRELWAGLTNAALERAGVGERVSHLSHAARGLEQAPTAHLGPSATALERRGVATDRGDTNRAVEAHRTAQEAVAGNEALLSHLDKAARAADRLQAQQQASEWERRDQAALTRYRVAVEQAEATGDELEVVEQRGRLAKAEELVAGGKHPAHFGTAINQAGEQAGRAWLQDQAQRNQAKEPGPQLSPEEARKMAYRAMSEQELRDQIRDLRRDTPESRLNADPIFRQRVESLDKCSREAAEAREKADKARRDLRGVDAKEAAYRQNHPILAWLYDKGLLGNGQITALEQQRHGLETSIVTADDAIKAKEAAEKRAHDVAVERQDDILPGIKAALEPKRQQAAEMDEVLTEKRTARYAQEEAERQAKRQSRGKGLGR